MIARAREFGGRGLRIYSKRPLKKAITNNKEMKKTIENLIYMEYDENELCDLPGTIEAPQLLVSLSNKFNFKVLYIYLEK